MPAPDKVLELVERFAYNLADYKQGKYNETQLRREFIDPFFKALGWDVDNEQGYAEAYKDVVHEDAIKVGQATKAPDYSFRVGGTRKFFLEAKKPSINIKTDLHPAYQLRRYAWSAKLPLSILTDFEEFAVYDCRIKPVKTDKPATARTLYLTYQDYPDRWDDLAAIFSRQAILKGSFDKYVESHKAKRGTAEVDDAFLREIERWRDMLARNLALRNPHLSQRELNYAVQLTIDRLIFLRICEDRGIEPYGRLRDVQKGGHLYSALLTLFRQADDRYNSGLFHFKKEAGRPEAPDQLTPGLTVDDRVLKDILQNLYYPDSPYEFSVLPAEILGQVYEQFLGKVIRLTPAHRAVVEDKPEVKKAGGVYYTPTYIVDYIVKQTVGKLVEGKKPGPRGAVSHLRILDPACGSGSFLLGAYQYLLDWHLEQYLADDPSRWATGRNPRLYQTATGEWKLTTDERKRILLNNIYGVDIDPQAVEVTKLSLLLKVLEGENQQTLGRQLSFLQERVLPDLGNNIKCGNALIGPDFYDGQQLSLLAEEEMYRINAFDWRGEFPQIMAAGGFDAVIGNPPYVRQETLGSKFKSYAKEKFLTYVGTADLYVSFIEQSHHILNSDGYFGMICSNKFMRANYGKTLRKFLATQTKLLQIVDFGELSVFQNASTFPAILITQNKPTTKQHFTYAPIKHLKFQSLIDEVKDIGTELDNRSLAGNNWTLARREEIIIIDKMKQIGVPLGTYVDGQMYRGVVTGRNEAFVIDRRIRDSLIAEDPSSANIIKPFLIGNDVRYYQLHFQEKYLIFTRRGINLELYPAVNRYLTKFKEQLAPKPKDWKGTRWPGRKPGSYQWYEIQDTVEYFTEFDKPKIIYPVIAKESRFAFDRDGFFSNDKTFIIPRDDLYLLGVLNSKLCWLFLKRLCSVLGDPDKGGRLELRDVHLKQLPIRTIDFSNPTDKAHHDQMVSLVETMLDLHRQLAAAKMPQAKTILQRQIEATDRQIDRLVYELYGLSEEEVRIVEEAG